MFIYMAVSNEFRIDQDRVKIGLCYGDPKHKYKNVRYKEGFDIVKMFPIQARDTVGGEWIEFTTRELLKADYYWLHHIPNDRFQVNTLAHIIQLYEKVEEYVAKAQVLYNDTFHYSEGA